MDIKNAQEIFNEIAAAPDAQYSLVLTEALKKRSQTLPAFLDFLSKDLEKPLPQLKYTTDQLINVLKQHKNNQIFQKEEILKKIPENRRKEIKSSLSKERFPTLAEVLNGI